MHRLVSRRAFTVAAAKYDPSPGAFVCPTKTKRDAIIIGGGHNGLICAAYLAKANKDVLVLERRNMLGGAAVTEEIIPGFKFSRGSYLAGLLRPCIIEELDLHSHGFEYLTRSPSSFTPTLPDDPEWKGRSLFLGATAAEDKASIAQFSQHDADLYEEYDDFLHKVRQIISPLLDAAPPNIVSGTMHQRRAAFEAAKVALKHRNELVSMYELFTGPATQLLNRWFDSEILKTTLATDAVIGSTIPPSMNGSAYVLIHHVMGSAAGRNGVWSYVKGGMGQVSQAVATVARNSGAELVTNASVRSILTQNGKAIGVEMTDGAKIFSDIVISNATPYHTFLELLPESDLPSSFVRHVQHTDYGCGAFKINCAVKSLPNFLCMGKSTASFGPEHCGTVHFESRMNEIELAARQALTGVPAEQPVIEMTIPSVYDKTIAPPSHHVVQLFVQFAPYLIDPARGSWDDPHFKEAFVRRVFSRVDKFAPGFSDSIIGYDALSPRDLERIFALHQGNIMHGGLGIHQLAYCRPVPNYSDYTTPIEGLYLCGAGCHPGGGVMGAPGRNCANHILSQ